MGTKTDDLGQKKFTDFRDGGKFSSHKALILLLKGKRQLQKNKNLEEIIIITGLKQLTLKINLIF